MAGESTQHNWNRLAKASQAFFDSEDSYANAIERPALQQEWIEVRDESEHFLTRSYHHSFSDYMNALVAAGFSIECLMEPEPPAQWRQKFPAWYAAQMAIPSFALFLTRKISL